MHEGTFPLEVSGLLGTLNAQTVHAMELIRVHDSANMEREQAVRSQEESVPSGIPRSLKQ